MKYHFAKPAALFVILLVMSAQGCGRSQGSQQSTNQGGGAQTFQDAQTAATQALATFRKLVNAQNYRELGFDSPDEAGSATLGEPIKVLIVRLDQLSGYQPGSDPSRLLSDANQVFYPVNARERVRSSITVEQVDGKWRAASLGNAGLANQISEVRKGTPTSTADVIVQVPALGLYFIGRPDASNKLMLTSLATSTPYNLRAGATQPAEEVFAALVPFARSHNGLPM